MNPMDVTGEAAPALLNDVRQLIEQARAHVASAADGEASPIGLILCASADREQVALMDLESANIRVAQLPRERQAYVGALAAPENKE